MKTPCRLMAAVLPLALALLSGCANIVHPSSSAASMTTANPTPASTFCMGRFLIDLPPGARMVGSARNKYDFAQIQKTEVMSSEQFDKLVNAREAKLKAAKHRVEQSLLRQSVRPDSTTRVLAFWEEDFTRAVVDIEGYRWIDGQRFLITDEAGTSPPKEGSISRQDLVLNRVQDALSRLRPRVDTDIPSDPGYCFQGGFIANERWRNEESMSEFRFSDYPDAYVMVWFFPLASGKRDKPLLDRMGGAVGALGRLAARVQVLRQGNREIAGFKGQEYLVSAPNSDGMRAHSFQWETQGEGTLQRPYILIQMDTGKAKGEPRPTRLSNDEAMALWDRIVSTFRVRPTGGAAASKTSDAGPLLPLGEIAATGKPCPQSGWWECADTGDVQGGRRQFFQQGQAMPQAVLLGKPSAWQKLKGEAPSHATTTVWKLVDYARDDGKIPDSNGKPS